MILSDTRNSDRNRFFSLALRKPRGPPKKAMQNERSRRGGRGKADEEDLLRNLALLESKGTLSSNDVNDSSLQPNGADSADADDEDDDTPPEKPISYEYPHPRFNAQLAVQDDTLFIYGGTFERGDREFTFDEMHAVDLGKLDGVRELFRREVDDWQGSEDEEDSEDEDDDGEEGSSDEDDNNEDETSTTLNAEKAEDQIPPPSARTSIIGNPPTTTQVETEADTEPDNPPSPQDTLPSPRPFESLRDFFTRSSHAWQDVIIDELKYKRGEEAERSVKEIRKGAFERAEQRWWDCREEVQVLEDEQEEAGIGEVVSIADRGGAEGSGTGGRRR